MSLFTSRFVAASDGLRLHLRDYGAGASPRTVVCLPGLARTAADFDQLAAGLLAVDPGRRVLALDYRGRGLSEADPDPARYTLPVEQEDMLGVFAALDIERAVVVGTSRGGLHAMALAASGTALLQGVVLNDIGPVLEPAGLRRIQGYVGKLPRPASWPEAVALLQRVAGAQFTGLSEAEWDSYARTTFEERADGFVARYDPALARNLAAVDPDDLPALWEAFDALAAVPLLVIRGANSDLLSTATMAAMAARHPACETLTVPGQGHAPLLTDRPTIRAIDAFVARCHAAAPPPRRAPCPSPDDRRRGGVKRRRDPHL